MCFKNSFYPPESSMSGINIKKTLEMIIFLKKSIAWIHAFYRSGGEEWKSYFQKVGNEVLHGENLWMTEHCVYNSWIHYSQILLQLTNEKQTLSESRNLGLQHVEKHSLSWPLSASIPLFSSYCVWYCAFPHFTDGDTEAQVNCESVTCARSHSCWKVELRFPCVSPGS